MQTITPFLWFDGQAEEAANHYVSIFPESEIVDVSRGPDGGAVGVTFRLGDRRFIAFNGGPMFRFSEAVSMMVNCDSQAEIDLFWDRLTEGGTPQRCGWLKDRFGLSWQVVPSCLPDLLYGPDRERSQRVMQAMMEMEKFDIAGLRRAYDGL